MQGGDGVMASVDLDNEDLRMLRDQQQMLAKEREIRQRFEARMEEEEERLRQTRAAQRVFTARQTLSPSADAQISAGTTPPKAPLRIPNVRFRLRLGHATSQLALGQRVQVAVGQWKLVLRQSIAAVCGISLHNVTLIPPKNTPEEEAGTEVKVMATSKQEAYRIAGAMKIAGKEDGLRMAMDNRGLGIKPTLVGEPTVDTGDRKSVV